MDTRVTPRGLPSILSSTLSGVWCSLKVPQYTKIHLPAQLPPPPFIRRVFFSLSFQSIYSLSPSGTDRWRVRGVCWGECAGRGGEGDRDGGRGGRERPRQPSAEGKAARCRHRAVERDDVGIVGSPGVGAPRQRAGGEAQCGRRKGVLDLSPPALR